MPSPDIVRLRTPLIAALLRGELPDAVIKADREEGALLGDVCIVHGVHGVLYQGFASATQQWERLPQSLRERLEFQARADMAWELAHKAELVASLSALRDSGVEVLILKGTALAYSVYLVPSVRSRGDTDLFVRANDVATLCDVLARLGYERDTRSQGTGAKVNLTKKDRFGLEHVLDVHWRLSSNELFCALFDWDEAHRMSRVLAALGAHARGLGQVHALLHACVHRAIHFHSPYYVDGHAYQERDRLIWLYDTRLLAGALKDADWSSFVERAREGAVCALCLDALRAAQELLGAAVPAQTSAALACPVQPELSAQLLSDSVWRRLWVECLAQNGFAARLRFLRRLFLPEPEYMYRKYPGQRGWLLPYLYVRRALEGAQKRIRRFR